MIDELSHQSHVRALERIDTSRDEAGHGRWSLSVHTPGWHTGQPFTVRAKTYTDGMPSVWSNGICSRPGDAGCPRA